MLKWFTAKDLIQLVVFVVGITLFLGGLKASNALNAATLSSLKEIQANHGNRIETLEIKQAERRGYEKAKRELVRNE